MDDPKPTRPSLWPNALFIGFSTFTLLLAALIGAGKGCGGDAPQEIAQSGGKDFIGVLRVDGVIISGDGGGGPFSDPAAGSDGIIKLLHTAEKNRHLKGLLIRINSPGGSAPASEEIHAALTRFKETTRKPVVVSMADVAASGGYYIAAPADRIFANRATFTGSIGVIFPILQYGELLKKIGLADGTITSGKFKDIGNPSRPMTKEERQMLQTMSDEVHQQFIEAVYAGRRKKLTMKELKAVADGRILTGAQAQKAKLVDEIGSYHDAAKAIGELAGLGPEPLLKPLRRQPSFFEGLFGELRMKPATPLAALPTDPFSLAAATLLLARLPGATGR